MQENVKFKYFSRSMDSFQGFFKTNFVFKDFSRLPLHFQVLFKPVRTLGDTGVSGCSLDPVLSESALFA